MNYQRTPTHDNRKHWTAVSTSLGLISSVSRCLHLWRSIQRPQIAVSKFYHWVTSSHRTQVTPNWLVIVIARPVNLNVSCKLHPQSLQRIRSPPGPRLPQRIRNTRPCNYYDPKGKDTDLHFLFFLIRNNIVNWIVGNSIHNIIPLLRKIENVEMYNLFHC